MTTTKTTQQFYSLVKEGKYQEALENQESFSFGSFENIFFSTIKPYKLLAHLKEGYIRYLFKEYLFRSKYFHQICNSSRVREWFEQLFSRRDLICPELYKRMAEEEPNCLMKAIQRNRVPFIAKSHFTRIIEHDPKNELIEFYYTASCLSIAELMHLRGALTAGKQLLEKTAREVFSLVGLWLYYYVWDLTVNKHEPDVLRAKESIAVKAVSHFLSWFLRNRNEIDEDGFDVEKFQIAILESSEEKPPHYDIFLAWLKWNHFVISFVDEFCYEDSVTIYVDENKRIHKEMNKDVYKSYYYNERKLSVYNRFEEDDFEELGTNLDLDDNEKKLLEIIGPVSQRDTRNLFDEFITSAYYEQTKINIEFCHASAQALILPDQLLFNYETKVGFSERKNWKEVLKNVSYVKPESKTFHRLPLSVANIDLNKNTNPKFMKLTGQTFDDVDKSYNCFTQDALQLKMSGPFNRFKEEINLFNALRFKIGNSYYCFPRLNASQRLHTFFTNQVLKVHKNKIHNKSISDEMEAFISKAASEKGFNAISQFRYKFLNEHNEQVSGEIDAVLWDNKIVLGIEFKHSPLKATLEEINREREITLTTASYQLNRFHRYLLTGSKDINHQLGIPEAVNLQDFTYKGLIITTNFEFDHELIDGKYYKISWKEWLWILENLKPGDNEKILALIEENYYWDKVVGV